MGNKRESKVHRVYLGEPSEKILIEVAGNIGRMPNVGGPGVVATYCDCSTCACDSCACNCSCDACGACYCDCSCHEDLTMRELIQNVETLSVKMGEMNEIINGLKKR